MLRQKEAELGGLSQGPGADSLLLLLKRGAPVWRVGAGAGLGGAKLVRGRCQIWRRGFQ